MSDQDERIPRDFFKRDAEEQQSFLDNTWCNNCQKVDLGMKEPEEYEFLDRIFIDGKCVVCDEITTTEIVEDDDEEENEDQDLDLEKND